LKNIFPEKLNKNKGVAAQLQKLLETGKVSHAYLFSGGSREDREEIGGLFADAILDRREDFIEIVKPDDKASIGTAQIGDFQKKIMLTPYGASYVALFHDCELITPEGQNKLLKTLEEPENAIIVMLASRSESLLPTVLSRCQVYQLEESALNGDAELEKCAAALAGAFEKKAAYYICKDIISPLLGKKEEQRARALHFLDILTEVLLNKIRTGNTELIYSAGIVQAAGKYMRQGHNVAYTLKQMCLLVQSRR